MSDKPATGWKRITLGELQIPGGIQGGPFGSQLHARDYASTGIPLIMPKNIGENRLLSTGHDLIKAEDAERLKIHQVAAGDIVVGRKGDLSRRALIHESEQGWVCGTDCIRIRVDHEAVSPIYLSYYMGLESVSDWLHRHDTGSTLPSLNTTSLARLPVILPDRQYQDAIANGLKALDDKIAVNDRIVATTDELAASLLDHVLSEDNGGSEALLSDVALVNQRKIAPTPGGHLRYIDISSVSVGSIDWPIRTPWSEAPGRARRGVSVGDTIWSTVRPGRRSFALILEEDPELVASTGFAVLTPAKVGPAFLHEVTKRGEFVQYLESVAEGSAYPAVPAERFERATIPLLSPSLLRGFEDAAMALRRRANSAQRESRTLADLRDTILPKLMSGEILVRDSVRVVEDST